MKKPPERFESRDLLLRRLYESDAGPLHAAALASYEQLHPWLPWAATPPVLATQADFLKLAQYQWVNDEAYVYGIFDQSGIELRGAAGLHARSAPDTLEIGYWIHVRDARRGYVTTSAAVLTAAAFDLPHIDNVEICCDEANVASAAVPRRLGYTLARIQDHEITSPAESGKRMIWLMTRSAYSGSPAEQRAHASKLP
jgi:RimJ/RimL family protein N-acetyltransferase